MSDVTQSTPCDHRCDVTSCDICNPIRWAEHYSITAGLHDKNSKLKAENKKLREALKDMTLMTELMTFTVLQTKQRDRAKLLAEGGAE